jgi:predicted RNA-binding protein with PIN domain
VARLLLVDAYNAMFRLFGEVPEDRDEARRHLLRLTRAAALEHRPRGGALERVHLVFDTNPGAERTGLASRSGKVSWLYAEGSADEEIVAYLREHGGRSGGHAITVVTDDRELAGRARQHGASTLSVRAFYGDVVEAEEPPAPRPPPPSARALPPLGPADFGLPEGPLDLDDPELGR